MHIGRLEKLSYYCETLMFHVAYVILKYNILDDLFDVYINQKYSILTAFK